MEIRVAALREGLKLHPHPINHGISCLYGDGWTVCTLLTELSLWNPLQAGPCHAPSLYHHAERGMGCLWSGLTPPAGPIQGKHKREGELGRPPPQIRGTSPPEGIPRDLLSNPGTPWGRGLAPRFLLSGVISVIRCPDPMR